MQLTPRVQVKCNTQYSQRWSLNLFRWRLQPPAYICESHPSGQCHDNNYCCLLLFSRYARVHCQEIIILAHSVPNKPWRCRINKACADTRQAVLQQPTRDIIRSYWGQNETRNTKYIGRYVLFSMTLNFSVTRESLASTITCVWHRVDVCILKS